MLMGYCDFYGVGVVKNIVYSAVLQLDCFIQVKKENKLNSTNSDNTLIIL